MLALLCAAAQWAWANELAEVLALTHTTSADWTPLDGGSISGKTLGKSGSTTYFYITDNLSFSNSTVGGSGYGGPGNGSAHARCQGGIQ